MVSKDSDPDIEELSVESRVDKKTSAESAHSRGPAHAHAHGKGHGQQGDVFCEAFETHDCRSACGCGHLHRAGWQATFISAVCGFVALTLGLIGLGKGELGEYGHGCLTVLTARMVCWSILFVIPSALVSFQILCFVAIDFIPFVDRRIWPWPSVVLPFVQQERCKHVIASLFAPILLLTPLLIAGILIMVPLGDGHFYHLGLLPVSILSSVRSVVSYAALRLVSFDKARRAYIKAAAIKTGIFVHVLPLIICFGMAVLLQQGGWGVAICLPPILSMYEVVGTLLVEGSFVDTYVTSPTVMKEYAGQQAVFPSITVAFLHCNAESMRLALMLAGLCFANKELVIVGSLASTFVVNVPIRTRWSFKLLYYVSNGLLHHSNFVAIFLASKFQMGYPRFLAVAAVGVARLVLGKSLMPTSLHTWGTLAFLAEEVLEDLVVLICTWVGITPKLADAPQLTQESANRLTMAQAKAAWRSTPKPRPKSKSERRLRLRCCRTGIGIGIRSSRVADTGKADVDADIDIDADIDECTFDDVVPCKSVEEVQRGHRYRYQLQPNFPILPQWAHNACIWIPQINMVVVWILFGGGLYHILGLREDPNQIDLGDGILWWPTIEDQGGYLYGISHPENHNHSHP